MATDPFETQRQARVHEYLCGRLGDAGQQQVQALQLQISPEPVRLQGLFVAALLDADPTRARARLVRLAPLLDAPVAAMVPRMRSTLRRLPASARLPLLLALLPALAALSPRARRQVLRVTRALGAKLAPQDTLRFSLSRLVLRALGPATAAQPGAETRPPWAAPEQQQAIDAACAVLCSLLAGQTGPRAAAAYHAGMDGLVPAPRRPVFGASPLDAAGVDGALEVAEQLPLARRIQVCHALLRVVAVNGTGNAAESDLLRLVSQCLGVASPATGANGS